MSIKHGITNNTNTNNCTETLYCYGISKKHKMSYNHYANLENMVLQMVLSKNTVGTVYFIKASSYIIHV